MLEASVEIKCRIGVFPENQPKALKWLAPIRPGAMPGWLTLMAMIVNLGTKDKVGFSDVCAVAVPRENDIEVSLRYERTYEAHEDYGSSPREVAAGWVESDASGICDLMKEALWMLLYNIKCDAHVRPPDVDGKTVMVEQSASSAALVY